MSKWILIAIIALNIYVFLNMTNQSRIDVAHVVAQIPAKIGVVIQDMATKIEESK